MAGKLVRGRPTEQHHPIPPAHDQKKHELRCNAKEIVLNAVGGTLLMEMELALLNVKYKDSRGRRSAVPDRFLPC